MKHIINLFLWLCTATLIAQACILGLSYFRGNLDKNSVLAILAEINGIDIQGRRLSKEFAASKSAPVPTFEDIAAERAKLSLEFDSREASLTRMKDMLDVRAVDLQNREKRFDERRNEFYVSLEEMRKGTLNAGLAAEQNAFENLAPEMAKSVISDWKKEGKMKDKVNILKGIPTEKLKKILAEFTPAESTQVSEILNELRQGDPVNTLVDKTLNGLKGGP